MVNKVESIKKFLTSNSIPLLPGIEVFSIIYLDSEPINWPEILRDTTIEYVELTSLSPENWQLSVQEKLTTHNVALLINQQELEMEWSTLINWKNKLNQLITNGSDNLPATINTDLFLLISVDDSEHLDINSIKKLSEAIYNYNVEY